MGTSPPVDVILDPDDDWGAITSRATAGEPLQAFRHTRPGESDPQVEASVDGSRFRFRYADETEFLIDLTAQRVWGRTPRGQTLEDTVVYLLGPILGFIARARGVLCLHASAVVASHGAVAFIGPAGAGKSTLAAAFATAGVPVLSDDLVALRPTPHGFLVEPGSSFLRLWPQSTPATATRGELPRLAPDWDKRFLDLTEPPYSFASDPTPLRGIYRIDDSGGAPVGARNLTNTESILSIVGNTYANYMLTSTQRAEELEAIGRLVTSTPVRALAFPCDLDALPGAVEYVMRDVIKSLEPQA